MRKRWLISIWIWLGIGLAGLWAQGTPVRNPFDITNRLPQRLLTLAAQEAPSDSVVNPFNVVPHRLPGVARGISQSVEITFRPLEVLPRGHALSTTFLFWLLVGLLAFLSFAVATQRNVVIKAWRGFLNDSALSLAQKEAAGFLGSTPYFLLYASFLLNAGAFIFLIARFFNPKVFNNPGFLVISMLVSGLLFLSKHLFLSVLGWLFPVAAEVRRYNFLILIFNCVLGLFLVPFNFLIAFVQEYGEFLVFWALGLVLVFYAYRSLRAAVIGRKFLGDHVFHFLLYLCSVEIAPVVILIKLAMLAAK